jgi:hypothetical protein
VVGCAPSTSGGREVIAYERSGGGASGEYAAAAGSCSAEWGSYLDSGRSGGGTERLHLWTK